jgi:hypothetical protein
MTLDDLFDEFNKGIIKKNNYLEKIDTLLIFYT